jgi:lipoprotein-releasing system ATP-binding protein
MDAVRASEIVKSYNIGRQDEIRILDGASLDVRKGEAVAVTGPSGSGKTTLLNILGTLDTPDSGHVYVDGCDLDTLSGQALRAFRNRHIGFVFQLHHLLPHLTALENVLLPTMINKTPDRLRRASSLLDAVGLGSRSDHRPGMLSGGERQRVAVARALVNRPALLLADEPTGSLDHESAVNMAELLFGLVREQGVSLVVVTHSREVAAKADRNLELRDGFLRDA